MIFNAAPTSSSTDSVFVKLFVIVKIASVALGIRSGSESAMPLAKDAIISPPVAKTSGNKSVIVFPIVVIASVAAGIKSSLLSEIPLNKLVTISAPLSTIVGRLSETICETSSTIPGSSFSMSSEPSSTAVRMRGIILSAAVETLSTKPSTNESKSDSSSATPTIKFFQAADIEEIEP